MQKSASILPSSATCFQSFAMARHRHRHRGPSRRQQSSNTSFGDQDSAFELATQLAELQRAARACGLNLRATHITSGFTFGTHGSQEQDAAHDMAYQQQYGWASSAGFPNSPARRQAPKTKHTLTRGITHNPFQEDTEASEHWLWRFFLKLWPPGRVWAGLLAVFNTFVLCIVFTLFGADAPAAIFWAAIIGFTMYGLWPR